MITLMDEQEDRITRAPWGQGQVESLNAYQAAAGFHPFTCGNQDCRARARPKQATLIACPDGWYCPRCRYAQDWAHMWMADGSWRQLGGAHIDAFMGTTHGVLIDDTGPMITKTGRVLTDAGVDAWADEAAESGPQEGRAEPCPF